MLRVEASRRVVTGADSSAVRISRADFNARRMNGSSESRLSVNSLEQFWPESRHARAMRVRGTFWCNPGT
jgi:hypothetical protein